MKNDRLLKSTVITIVSLLHAGLIMAGWQAAKPAEPVTVDNLTFIDLGSPEGDDKPKAEGAPAPLDPAPAPEPPKPEQPKPKKVEPPKPVETPQVKTVIRDNVKPDITPPKPNTPKPPPQPDPTPPKEPEQELKPTPPKPPATPPNNTVAGGKPNAANRSADAPANGGGGTDPNSKVPENGSGGVKGGDGKGAKGPGGGNQGGGQGGNSIVDGGYINLPMPPYPRLALENEEEGTVRIEVIVEPNGNISSAKIVKSSGSSRLDSAALKAARGANIKPKMINGEPVRSRFITPFNFKLS